jgi:hypothetical protein
MFTNLLDKNPFNGIAMKIQLIANPEVIVSVNSTNFS